MIKDQKIEKFLEDVASSKPTPGGGAVAAITGATAAALVEMVINLTKGDELRELGAKVSGKRQEFYKLADSDAKAFDEVIASFQISKEEATRKEKIQQALKTAAEVPLQVAKLSKEINEYAKEALEKGNKNAVSDAQTAVYLSDAAMKSAIENVKINLASIKDTVFVEKMEEALASLK